MFSQKNICSNTAFAKKFCQKSAKDYICSGRSCSCPVRSRYISHISLKSWHLQLSVEVLLLSVLLIVFVLELLEDAYHIMIYKPTKHWNLDIRPQTFRTSSNNSKIKKMKSRYCSYVSNEGQTINICPTDQDFIHLIKTIFVNNIYKSISQWDIGTLKVIIFNCQWARVFPSLDIWKDFC